MNRRAFLGALAGAAASGIAGVALASRRGSSDTSVLRLGTMANLTHAPVLAGLGSGRLARAVAPARLEATLFRAGPRVTEALIGDAIDVGTTGPAAAVVHHARHARHAGRGDGGLRVLAGCASGGASLVVARSARVAGPADLRGKTLAVTQLGTTQDVTLRAYLAEHGLRDAAAGGDVRVIAISGATILAQMRSGGLDGAWLPEPWATRVVRELGATRLVDERDLWEGRRFATALLVSRADRLAHPAVPALVAALAVEVARARLAPAETRDEAYAELARRLGDPGKRAIFDEAFRWVDFTSDPLRPTVETFAARAAKLGLLPEGADVSGLFAS